MSQSRVSPDPQIDQWMTELSEVYGEKKEEQFNLDEAFLRQGLMELKMALKTNYAGLYSLEHAYKMGGTGIVFKASQKNTKQALVLKFNRPKLVPDIMSMVENERRVLPKLDHPNIIRAIDTGMVEVKLKNVTYKLSFIIEPFVPNALPVSKYLQSLLPAKVDKGSLERALHGLTALLLQWTIALKYLHDNGFLHLDVKPDNAMVDSNGRLTAIDFGSVREFFKDSRTQSTQTQETGYFEGLSRQNRGIKEDEKDESSVDIIFTYRYAHPDIRDLGTWTDPSKYRVKAGLKRKSLQPKLDYYALGKSIIELLEQIAQRRPSICPHLISFRYLNFLASRLLDGKNQETSDPDTYAREIFSGLKQSDYERIGYPDLNEVIQDLEKELGAWNPELKIPELETYSKDLLRVVPFLNTVITDRLRAIMEHPVFARLKLTTELGLIGLVYPTADHSRYDHVLGTYTYVGAYIKSLFNDRQNPLFRNLVDEHDIKAVLLASLFHDLGQYPLAHDLEEVCPGIFGHARISEELLEFQQDLKTQKTREDKAKPLSALIREDWGVDPDWVKQILGAHSTHYTLDQQRQDKKSRDFKVDMLSALIDGPIDADKADYIIRDTFACAIPYGEQLDVERLLKVLTVAVISDPVALHRVTIGVYEKGRAAAESFGLARHLLFAAVYWHHTSRTLKSMLQYAVAMELPSEVFTASEGEQIASLHAKLTEFITGLLPPFDKSTLTLTHFQSEDEKILADKPPPDQVHGTLTTYQKGKRAKKELTDAWYPGISWTDWLMLVWLKRELPNPNPKSDALIDGILTRNIYRRVTTFHRNKEGDLASSLDRLFSSWPDRVEFCKRLHQRIHDRVMTSYQSSGTDSEKDIDKIDKCFSENLAVLVDLPDPSKKTGFESSRPLTFVPELKQKSYAQEIEESEESAAWNQTIRDLMTSIGPIRVLCHPTLVEPINKALQVTLSGQRSSPLKEIKRIMLEILKDMER